MKYKTLCRLLVKLMGVYLVVQGLTYFPAMVSEVVDHLNRDREGLFVALQSIGFATWMVVGSVLVGVAVLWWNGAITNGLIPSNRPYCHECGYELTGAIGNRCPECGTSFQPVVGETEPHH
jgi:hypothetical protein